MNITKGKTGNALTSAAADHVIAVAADIYDETLDKYQTNINQEVNNTINGLSHQYASGDSATYIVNKSDEAEANWIRIIEFDDPETFGTSATGIVNIYACNIYEDSTLLNGSSVQFSFTIGLFPEGETSGAHQMIQLGGTRHNIGDIRIALDTETLKPYVEIHPVNVRSDLRLDINLSCNVRCKLVDTLSYNNNFTDNLTLVELYVENGVVAYNIGKDTVGTYELQNNAVETENILDLAVTYEKILNGAINAEKILNYTITTNKLSDNSISRNKILANAINAEKIAPETITNDLIANGTIINRNLADDTVFHTVLLVFDESFKLVEAITTLPMDDNDGVNSALNKFIGANRPERLLVVGVITRSDDLGRIIVRYIPCCNLTVYLDESRRSEITLKDYNADTHQITYIKTYAGNTFEEFDFEISTTNDFTNENKEKLDALPTNAELTNTLATKADISDLSNVTAEEVIDGPLKAEIEQLTREEIKKDLFIDMWNNACTYKAKPDIKYGKYNTDTGYFELNDITDITYEEALTIYELSASTRNIHKDYKYLYAGLNTVRTLFPLKRLSSGFNPICGDAFYMFFDCIKLEVISTEGHYESADKSYISPGIHVININNIFDRCYKLREFRGLLRWENGIFKAPESPLLEVLVAYALKTDMDMSKNPLWNLYSIQKTIELKLGVAEQKAVTITVHPDVYAKITGDTTNAAAAALTEEELAQWQQLLVDASAKNITFATV